MGQGWWFTLIVATYNVLDTVGRLPLRLLQRLALTLSPQACLAACAARLPLLPLIYGCVVRADALGGSASNVILLLATAALAVSNGVLATASMMQVPRLAPRGLQEEAVYVAVAGTYFGLAAGASTSYLMSREVLHVAELHCGVPTDTSRAHGGL